MLGLPFCIRFVRSLLVVCSLSVRSLFALCSLSLFALCSFSVRSVSFSVRSLFVRLLSVKLPQAAQLDFRRDQQMGQQSGDDRSAALPPDPKQNSHRHRSDNFRTKSMRQQH